MILLPRTLSHMSSFPMGEINFYMQEHFLPADTTSLLFKCSYVYCSHGCNVRAWNLSWASVAKPVLWQLMILWPCTLPHTSSIQMGAINFYMQEHFLHSLKPLLFSCLRCIYMQEYSVHSLRMSSIPMLLWKKYSLQENMFLFPNLNLKYIHRKFEE